MAQSAAPVFGPRNCTFITQTFLACVPVPDWHVIRVVNMVDMLHGVHNRDTIAVHPQRQGGATLSPQAQSIARHRAPRQISPVVLFGLVRLSEFAAIVLIGVNLYYAYVWSKAPDMELAYWVVTILVALATVVALETLGQHRTSQHDFISQSAYLIGVWTGLFAGMIALGFFTRLGGEFSRVWLSVWFLAGAGSLLLIRLGTAISIRIWVREGRLQRRAVIVGGGARAATYRQRAADLAGAAVVVPDNDEVVALGAAVQAAATHVHSRAASFAERWRLGAGLVVEPRDPDGGRAVLEAYSEIASPTVRRRLGSADG